MFHEMFDKDNPILFDKNTNIYEICHIDGNSFLLCYKLKNLDNENLFLFELIKIGYKETLDISLTRILKTIG